MLLRVFREILLAFASSLGVLLGGSIFGGAAALFTKVPPAVQMRDLARILRMWAVVVAIGGTFPTARGDYCGFIGFSLRILADHDPDGR